MNKYQEALDSIVNELIECGRTKDLKGETILNEQIELNLLRELVDNPPLKFEELEKGMWVWDDKEKWYRKIVILFNPCSEYPKGSFKSYADSCETSLDFIEFEENRFYRREITNEKIQ